jgi:hypothetical protein
LSKAFDEYLDRYAPFPCRFASSPTLTLTAQAQLAVNHKIDLTLIDIFE